MVVAVDVGVGAVSWSCGDGGRGNLDLVDAGGDGGRGYLEAEFFALGEEGVISELASLLGVAIADVMFDNPGIGSFINRDDPSLTGVNS